MADMMCKTYLDVSTACECTTLITTFIMCNHGCAVQKYHENENAYVTFILYIHINGPTHVKTIKYVINFRDQRLS